MQDLLYTALGTSFFVLAFAYVHFCDKVR